ncbi:hypothetical protein FIBSPDRAFT_870602, partial [Athelia psychrophila]
RTSRICDVEGINMKLCLRIVTGREGCTKTPRSFERPNDHLRRIQGLPVMKGGEGSSR